MLGDFAKSPPAKLLTGKRETAGGTNEALVELDGARLATFNEPESMGVIQADVMKIMSGGRDKISARGLHEKQRTFQPTFKMFLACNVIPRMSENTEAVWRRVQVIHFPMKFCENPDPENPLEAKIDVDLSDTLPILAPYFASFLLPYLRSVRNSGLQKPVEVEHSTTSYRAECDLYADFWTDCMENHGNVRRTTLRSPAKQALRLWIKRRDLPTLSNQELIKYLDDKMKFYDTHKQINGESLKLYGYVGWSLKNEFRNED